MNTAFIIIGFFGGIASAVTFMNIIQPHHKLGALFLFFAIGLFVMGFIGMERDNDEYQAFQFQCEQLLEKENIIQYLKDDC